MKRENEEKKIRKKKKKGESIYCENDFNRDIQKGEIDSRKSGEKRKILIG